MIKIITSLIKWLTKGLNNLDSWLESKDRSDRTKYKFVDLAPTDEADKTGVYSEAILFATNNARVSNIALTGPYGSGKSSIVQSFLKKYPRPTLHISLATFIPETYLDDNKESCGEIEIQSDKVSRQEIERSILQQMLYGADSNKLPLSRFKRIQFPGVRMIFKSLYITLGILVLWYVLHKKEEIISIIFTIPLDPDNWLNFGIFVVVVTFLWSVIHRFYVASLGLSIKSISLKDVEIKPTHDDEASILNRHLDEIIYFFQSTDYDLVIIEDLDRFNNADIFITLREINSLVNENAGVKRTIRFLYALRDDMFANTDRTKFFEFIIPVIPIINTSNSIDMVLKQGRRLELDDRLDRQFLREVSRYLNDLRLIQNIFNEYAIYVANLESDGENLLDTNKLLAILIYKNVYPRDFELLHAGSGAFANILNLKEKLIRSSENEYKDEISKLEKQLEAAEEQTPLDIKELQRIYAMALIEKLPENVFEICFDGGEWINIRNMVTQDDFEKVIDASILYYGDIRYKQYHVDILELQNEVNPNKTYQQRKVEIESKQADNKKKTLSKIHDLKSKISGIRTTKLNEILRLNPNHVQDFFKNLGIGGELARFLIFEGYLDDTYYQYTSLFHSGRLSPSDNSFLIQIRAFITPEPNFPIDNPKEVVAAMRNEDFRQSYVLNVKIVDTLLNDPNSYSDQREKLFEYLSLEFENSEAFFDTYYNSGRNIVELLSGLESRWEGLVPAVIADSRNITHITQLVANLPMTLLTKLASEYEQLPTFVSERLSEILVNLPELDPERLVCLNFEVKELEAIKEHSEIVQAMFDKGLYKLTITNLEYIYKAILGEADLKLLNESNFTAIRSTNNATLMKRIKRDFDHYLRDILLGLQGNSNEDVPAILEVISNDSLEKEYLKAFLERQTAQLPSLDGVPERLQKMLLSLNMIKPTWMSCLVFMENEEFEADSLVTYLDRDDVRESILDKPIPSDPHSLELHQFLFKAYSLSDVAYRDYIRALPWPSQEIPEGAESTKLQILIEEEKVIFDKENFDSLGDIRDLQVLFVVVNIDEYLSDPESITMDDNFLEDLLKSDIELIAKIRIVKLMDLREVLNLPNRAALIGSIIQSDDEGTFDFDADIIICLIEHSKSIETKISLLNKYHDYLEDEEVFQVLADFPRPFSEIKTGRKTPKLENNLRNKELVRWLDSRNIISSWSQGRTSNDKIKVNLYRG